MRSMMEFDKATENVPLGKLGTETASAVHGTVIGHGWLRNVTDVLHGTWLGHPLHSAITDFTIGAWMSGGVFDIVGELADSDTARRAGDGLAALGLVMAVPTGLSGLADFSTVPKEATRQATLHGLLNLTNVALYGLSVLERSRGNRGRGLAFSFLAQGLTLASAWIGGSLVYEHGVGTDHREVFTGPKDWTPVLADADLAENAPRRVEVDGKGVLLYRHEGTIYAIGAVCSHAGGPLEEGTFEGTCVQCPWHDSVFDLRDGSVVHGPATYPEDTFDVRVRDGRIELRLAS